MSDTFGSTDELLDFAISKEEEANQFYTDLATRMEKSPMREVFEHFAAEELKHKARLEAVKRGKLLVSAEQKVQNLKIADYLVEIKPEPDETLDYQKALMIAMQREKASFKLYTDLAAITDNAELQETLLALAQEEAKHKLRFEIEYDEHILTEN
jgi:rubrerythrin